MVIISSIVGGKKLLAYVEKRKYKYSNRASGKRKKRKKAAEEAPQISEGEIISTMHKMVHQKVKSSEKWGFVEMTKKEISNVKRDIENSTGFQYKMKLFSIINRWGKRRFFLKLLRSITFYGAFKVEILARRRNVYRQKRKSSI